MRARRGDFGQRRQCERHLHASRRKALPTLRAGSIDERAAYSRSVPANKSALAIAESHAGNGATQSVARGHALMHLIQARLNGEFR